MQQRIINAKLRERENTYRLEADGYNARAKERILYVLQTNST